MSLRRPFNDTARRRGYADHRTVTRGLFALLLVYAATACGDPAAGDSGRVAAPGSAPPNAEQGGPASGPQYTEQDTLLNRIEQWTGDLDGMQERRIIRILTVYSVGRYFLDGARESGLVKESATAFEAFINQRRPPQSERIYVVIVPVARDQLVPALLAGRGDIIAAGLTITPERQQQLDFSAPLSRPFNEILITGPASPALRSIDDLAGRTLHLRESSSYQASIAALNARFTAEGRPTVAVLPVSGELEDADLVEMVNAGMLPWTVADEYKVAWWRDAFTSIEARHDIVFRKGGQLAWAVRPGSPLLLAAIDDFAKTHREGTLLGNILRNRYIRDFDWAANATDPTALQRFEALRGFFRQYGDQFGFDPLMLAAQGFQESRLDQTARNRSGAIGIMQIKQSTADDPQVAVSDIHRAGPNIHAGTKYLAFLRDRYFNTPDIDPANRAYMALAAYNMGPASMIRVREKARQLGYDHTIWFDNVEIAAAAMVGHEPVTYVANITKYYVAYKLIREQLLRREEARERAGMD